MVAVTVNIPVISAGSLWDQTPDQSSFFFFFFVAGVKQVSFQQTVGEGFPFQERKDEFSVSYFYG